MNNLLPNALGPDMASNKQPYQQFNQRGPNVNMPQYGGLMKALASQGSVGDDGVQDTELVHVNEKEKALLKSLGGSGTINPRTGLRQYDHEDDYVTQFFKGDLIPNLLGSYNKGYMGHFKGSDQDWLADRKKTQRFLTGMYDMIGMREDIEGNYFQGMKDWKDRYSLLGTSLSEKYQPLERKRRFGLGKGGLSFGESVAPESAYNAKSTAYESGKDTLMTDKYSLNKGYQGEIWDLIGSGKSLWSNWVSSLDNPYYKDAMAGTFDSWTKNMDWFDEPSSQYDLGSADSYASPYQGSESWWEKQKNSSEV